MKRLTKILVVGAALGASMTAAATPVSQVLANDIAAVSSKKTLMWAEPMGLVGFDIGASIDATNIEDQPEFELATGGGLTGGNFYTTTVMAMKGLPMGFDIGGHLTTSLKGDFSGQGVEIRYALLDGTFATPALGVSVSYDQAKAGDYDYQGYGVDLALSKGFANVTPFVGVGMIKGDVKYSGIKTNVELNKFFAGVNINLLFADLMAAVNNVEDNQTYSLKLGFTF